MRKLRINQLLLVALSVLVVSITLGAAQKQTTQLRAKLTGLEEASAGTVLTDGTGTFTATINDDATLSYTLTYSNLSSALLQAHIHIGATKINGGVAIFLCSNLVDPLPPAGTPACPDDATHSGLVSRTVSAADVTEHAADQGLTPGDFTILVRAILSHVTYVNVHTAKHPDGELRGQVRSTGDKDDELPDADHHHHND